jgi:hypothetical protein
MKEGEEGTRRAGKPKKKNREPKTKLKKMWFKKGTPEEENFVKKQISNSIQHVYPSSQ